MSETITGWRSFKPGLWVCVAQSLLLWLQPVYHSCTWGEVFLVNDRQKALLCVGYAVGCFNTYIVMAPSEPAETVMCVHGCCHKPQAMNGKQNKIWCKFCFLLKACGMRPEPEHSFQNICSKPSSLGQSPLLSCRHKEQEVWVISKSFQTVSWFGRLVCVIRSNQTLLSFCSALQP